MPVPTTMTPVPTMAPIVTHDARVGVGVLTPVAVAAPVRVVIPSLGADGPVAPTGVDAAGTWRSPAMPASSCGGGSARHPARRARP